MKNACLFAQSSDGGKFPIAISLGGGGGIYPLSLNNQSEAKIDFGYFFGGNIHIRPDAGNIGFLIKPRYSSFSVRSSDDYAYSGDATFKFISAKGTSFELPVLVEFCTNATDSYNFIAIGYAYGTQKIDNYRFTNQNSDPINQTITSNPSTIGKAMMEIGGEHHKFRISLWGAYQFTPLFNTDYRIIENEHYIKPFEDIKKGNYSFGLEITFRIWGSWSGS